ncbi:addiction module protein [Flavobacterium sp.]|uniref:addiction module protein n=1 Tax=Flavobacterium sp. TaxID=239 RepID=UPI001B7C14AC|nr:addiction module protein [Flavobacterium sp.]MBP6128133.1 addiction module protein [Flavobacterium sp.]
MKTIEIDTYSDAEKIILAEQLWDSVSKENLTLSDKVKAELDSRLKDLEDKNTKLFSWNEVKEHLKNIR